MQFALAFAALAATWLMLRRQAGGGTCPWLLVLDVGPILLGWLIAATLLRRPMTAAVIVFAAGAGLAVTDAVKRSTLREPLVFADRAELLEVVRHPQLYLPFAGPARIVGGAAVAVAAAIALIWLEPPVMRVSPVGPVLLGLLAILLPIAGPVLPRLAALYRRAGVTSDPALDMRRHGFLAALVIHATLARHERPRRRAAVVPDLPPARPGAPVVLVQVESFYDARRLGPAVPADLLPGFDRLCAAAAATGRLAVPCWGANTVRSEFAVLTGIDAAALGLDRFNPYERFALARTRSVAWQFKAAGYRTICLHPFDKRFYARDRVMPQLGFDEFRGPEAFAGAERAGRYVSDAAVAREAARIVREEGPLVFVFAMTIANHGPWEAAAGGELAQFCAGLRGSDRMFAPLMDALPPGGVLAIYGDHQPSLPALFAATGETDDRTDYAIWQAGAAPGPRRDIAAEDLAALVLTQTQAEARAAA